MKKFFCAAAAVAVGILSAVTFGGCKAGEAYVDFTLSGDGTYYIVSGVSGDKQGLTSYEIPATYNDLPVKEVGDMAFTHCNNLKSIKLPDTLKKIGASAFAFCAFEQVEIPEGVTYIGRGAFGACDYLKEVTVPESVTTLGELAFYSCGALETAYVKANITVLDNQVFYNAVYTQGGNTYYSSSLKKVYLSAGIQKIRDSALAGNFITDIYYAGTEEEWENVYFYNMGQDGENRLEKSDVLAGSVKVTCGEWY